MSETEARGAERHPFGVLSPQKLMGVGFASEGMDECVPYRRLPDSYDPDMAWIFDGVAGEIFGDNGLALGGAAAPT